jgi:hypothetical protein
MTGTASTRIIACLFLGTCSAFCQQPNNEDSLPEAPNAQTVNPTEILRSFIDTARQSVATPALANGASNPKLAPKYDPLHFETETKSRRRDATNPNAWTPALLKRNTAFHGSSSSSLVGRATDAALSVIVTRDECGQHKLNTRYLLRVLTTATAHVAERPYWRRSIRQPFSDFGSTVGNDAGVNVLHEFQPGLRELVKSHEPKFVSRIGQRGHHK